MSGHFPMRHMFTKFSTLFLCKSSTFMISNDVCRKSVRVQISRCMIYSNNLFCITWTLDIFFKEVFPYTSRPYFILEYINAWYSCRTVFSITLCRICLNIPKNFNRITFSTWAFHVSFSPIVNPRYVTTSTCLMFIASVSVLWRFLTNGLFRVWNKTKLFFSILIVNLFSIHQRHSFWIALDTALTNVFRSFSYNINAVSSAKSRVITFSIALYKSFIYNTKNSGPKMEPWGTAQLILRTSDLTPFT